MPKTVRTALVCLCFTGVLSVAAPAQAAPTKMEKRLVSRINDARQDRGLRTLRTASSIQSGAHSWSRHLLRTDSFHHARLRSGTGEVIAWGTCSWFKPGAAVRAWLRSPSHRTLLLRGSFRRVGTGWARGSWNGYGCVEMAVARFR
ncbi:MAG TPA: CAP domain-containing protein [Gaiellaceae bacterium]|jgi:uncharacterized protein YkwD|nr:CAP domain-containing protein [Gaiellaceae bacterium]